MMKAFYSILFANIKPIINEKLTIGLLMVDGDNIRFKYSKTKLNVVSKLLGKEEISLLRFSLNQIEKVTNTKKSEKTNLKFPLSIDKLFSESYFTYLSRYNNNLLTFSKPDYIADYKSESLFDSLYEKMVFKTDIDKARKNIKESGIKKNLYPSIESHVDIDIELNDTNVDTLIVPIHLNFIGRNGQPVTGKFIDFEKRIDLIHNDLSDYVSLTKSFEILGENGKYFLLGDEPTKKLRKQHHVWSHFKDLNIMETVCLNDYEKIIEYISDNDVQPFLK